MLGVLDAASNELTVIISGTERTTDFIGLLEVSDRNAPHASVRP